MTLPQVTRSKPPSPLAARPHVWPTRVSRNGVSHGTRIRAASRWPRTSRSQRWPSLPRRLTSSTSSCSTTCIATTRGRSYRRRYWGCLLWRSNCSVVFCCVLELLESARALVFVVAKYLVLGHGFLPNPNLTHREAAEGMPGPGPRPRRVRVHDVHGHAALHARRRTYGPGRVYLRGGRRDDREPARSPGGADRESARRRPQPCGDGEYDPARPPGVRALGVGSRDKFSTQR